MTLKYKSCRAASLLRAAIFAALGCWLLLFSAGAQQQAAQEQTGQGAMPGAAASSSARTHSAASPADGAASESTAIDALAAKMAEAIVRSKKNSVIVFDFANSDRKVTPLGQKMATEFNNALEKAATGFTIVSRADTPAWKSSLFYFGDSEIGFQEALARKAKVVIFGRVSLEVDDVAMSVDGYEVDDLRRIEGFEVHVPVTTELGELSEPAREVNVIKPQGNGGPGGYGYPTCVFCPHAEFSAEALKHHVTGVVILLAVVDVDGSARDITVEKHLGYGLDEKAIEAILKWKFRLAKGPDGSPAAVRVPIEIEFH